MKIGSKRKTRNQKKSRIVSLISLGVTILSATAIILSALFIPQKEELDSKMNGNYIQNVYAGNDSDYFVTLNSKTKEKVINGGFVYRFDKDNKLISSIDVYSNAKDKFGIELEEFKNPIDGLYTSYKTDFLYVYTKKYLFAYSGIKSNNFELLGYSDQFSDGITLMKSNGTDLYIVNRSTKLSRITRYVDGDMTFTPIKEGCVYEATSSGDKLTLKTSVNFSLYSMFVHGDYLYLANGQYIRKIHKDFKGIDYKVIYDAEYAKIAAEHPTYSESEINEIIIENHEADGWISYKNDDIVLKSSALSGKDFTFFYSTNALAGTLNYDEKETLFCADKYNKTLNTLSYSDLSSYNDKVRVNLDNLFVSVDNFDFKESIVREGADNIFLYTSGSGKYGLILYEDDSSSVSVFNLDDIKIKQTVGVSTRIKAGFYNESKDTISFLFEDPVNRESGVRYFSSCEVNKEVYKPIIVTTLVLSSILCAIAIIIALVTFLSFTSLNVMDKVIKTGRGLKKHWPIYLILFPSVFILGMFCYYPGIAAIITSFFDYKPGISDIKTWNNFQNYINIFGNVESLKQFANMALFLVADVVLAIIPPLIFGFFLTVMRSKKYSGVLRTLLFIPGIIPGIASLLIWRTGIYGEYGVVNSIISAFGGNKMIFFQASDYSNVFWLILMGFPFVGSYLIFYGAMMNIPSSYYEAAELDGISVWKRFFKIDLPLCLPQMKYVLIMTIIASIQNFARIYIAMGGNPGVVSTPIVQMYIQMYSNRDYGLSSAYATILFIILFGLTFLGMRKKMKDA